MSQRMSQRRPSLDREERINLALALLRRGEVAAAADWRYARLHPPASAGTRRASVFHLFVDGIDALLAVLADAERFLRGELDEVGCGEVQHALYHLRGYAIAQALLPTPAGEALEEVQEARACLADEDLEGARRTLERLAGRLEGRLEGH